MEPQLGEAWHKGQGGGGGLRCGGSGMRAVDCPCPAPATGLVRPGSEDGGLVLLARWPTLTFGAAKKNKASPEAGFAVREAITSG